VDFFIGAPCMRVDMPVSAWRLLGGSWSISVSWSGRDSAVISWWPRLRENIVMWTDFDWRLDNTDKNWTLL